MSEEQELSGFDQFLLSIAGLVGTGGFIGFAWALNEYWRPVDQWGVLGWLYLCIGGTVAFVGTFLVGLLPMLLLSGLQIALSSAEEAVEGASDEEEDEGAWKLCPKIEQLMDCLDSEQVTDLIDCDDELWEALAEADEQSLLHFKTELFDWLAEALKVSSPYDLVVTRVAEKCANNLPEKTRMELLRQLIESPPCQYEFERFKKLLEAWSERESCLELLCLYVKGPELPAYAPVLERICECAVELGAAGAGVTAVTSLWEECPEERRRLLVECLANAVAYVRVGPNCTAPIPVDGIREFFEKLPEALRQEFVEPFKGMRQTCHQINRLLDLGETFDREQQLKQWRHMVVNLAEGLAQEFRETVTEKWGKPAESTRICRFLKYDVNPAGGPGTDGKMCDMSALLAQLGMWVPDRASMIEIGKRLEFTWDGVIGCSHDVKLVVKRRDEGFGLTLSSECR